MTDLRHVLAFRWCLIFCAGLICFSVIACTKVVVYGVDTVTEAVTERYSSNVATAVQKAEEALKSLGYHVLQVDHATGRIKTGWRPVKASSHYLTLFKRREYSASQGAYYQLVVDVREDGPWVAVSVATLVKSVAGRLSSSHVVEKAFLKRFSDFMRSPQIEMTNVGVAER